MKKISTFHLILLCAFGAFAVAGVLVFALAVGGGNAGSSIGSVVIWGTLDNTAFSSVLDAAAESDQSLSQVSYVAQDPSTYGSDLTDALAAGTGPDLFIMSSDDAYADQGEVVPIPFTSLSQAQFQNTFVDAANVYLSTSTLDAFPFAVDPLVLYWNKDLLAGAGYAEPPTCWSQVPAMAQKLTQTDESGEITRGGIALGTYQNIDDAKYILATMIMQAGGEITARDNDGNLIAALTTNGGSGNETTVNVGTSGTEASDPAVSALNFYTEFANPSQSDYSWSGAMQDARQAFAAGDVAMYIGFASEEPLISAINPNLNFAAAPIPQLCNSSPDVDGGVVYAFAVPKTSGNAKGAFDVAQLLDIASTSGAFSQALGIPSARRDVLAMPSEGDDQLFNNMALITKTWTDPDPTQTDALFQAMIENTVSGADTPEAAVAQAQLQLQQITGQGQ